jgi:hypothetical protein
MQCNRASHIEALTALWEGTTDDNIVNQSFIMITGPLPRCSHGRLCHILGSVTFKRSTLTTSYSSTRSCDNYSFTRHRNLSFLKLLP